jgi:hypothetical protein
MSDRDGPRHWLGIYLNDLQGKAAGWRALPGAAANDGLLDQQRLRVLPDRAGDRLAVVEQLRVQAGAGLFSPG